MSDLKISVLDHGYVSLLGVLGDDLTPINAARVSMDKHTDVMRPKDKRLLRYLAEHNHTSPLRHAVLSFELYMPLMVARQISKYRVGSWWSFEDDLEEDDVETWNESSRRYVTEDPVFYIPKAEEWRSAPENKKQGSGPPVDDWFLGEKQADQLRDAVLFGIRCYQEALDAGICAEQARLFLPAYAMYIRARWTISLQGAVHFLQQRLHEDAQVEIRLFAEAVRDLVKPLFPESLEAFGL